MANLAKSFECSFLICYQLSYILLQSDNTEIRRATNQLKLIAQEAIEPKIDASQHVEVEKILNHRKDQDFNSWVLESDFDQTTIIQKYWRAKNSSARPQKRKRN